MTRRKVFYAVLAILLAGTAFYFVRRPEAVPVVTPLGPVTRGTEPLPPGTKVMPRIEPILETAQTIDLEKESARFADFFTPVSTAPVSTATSTLSN
jgi:hypothetical protein